MTDEYLQGIMAKLPVQSEAEQGKFSEDDWYKIEAADQIGFRSINDDADVYACTQSQIVAFAKMCVRAGLYQAHGMGSRDLVAKRIAEIDAEIGPIVEAERIRSLTAAGYVRDEAGKWVKPEPRDCTCHPHDAPPVPCAQKFALSECKASVQPKNDFWCVVALDYDKDEAWILDQSVDARHCDLLDGSSGEDNGLLQDWVKTAEPGLYKLALSPWGHGPDIDGEYDGGVDVASATLLVAFPKREPRPTEFLVSTIYGCTDDDFQLDEVATKAVGREIDECGWGGGERDIGWICESEDEVEQVKAALKSVGLDNIDVSEWRMS